MKPKFFLIGFLLLSILAFSMTVRAASYSWEVPEDTLFVYEIKSFDPDQADDVFVDDDPEAILGEDAEDGAMMARMITDVEEIEDFDGDAVEDDPGWEIDGWLWKYNSWTTNEDDFEDPEADDVDTFEDWKGNRPQIDDVLVLGVMIE